VLAGSFLLYYRFSLTPLCPVRHFTTAMASIPRHLSVAAQPATAVVPVASPTLSPHVSIILTGSKSVDPMPSSCTTSAEALSQTPIVQDVLRATSPSAAIPHIHSPSSFASIVSSESMSLSPPRPPPPLNQSQLPGSTAVEAEIAAPTSIILVSSQSPLLPPRAAVAAKNIVADSSRISEVDIVTSSVALVDAGSGTDAGAHVTLRTMASRLPISAMQHDSEPTMTAAEAKKSSKSHSTISRNIG
jgi:hypothetical protein